MSSCANCAFYGKNQFGGLPGDAGTACHFIPPATLAAALGLGSMYDVPPVQVHPEWSCGFMTARRQE